MQRNLRSPSISLLFLAALAAGSLDSAEVLLTEVLYHPGAPGEIDELGEFVEFVELWNASAKTIDLGGWKLAGGVTFSFPAGTQLKKDARLIVARNLESFQAAHGKEIHALGPFKGELKNSGEELELADATGGVVDTIAFSDKAPWPPGADGNGSSLERVSPASPARTAEHWAPSPLPADPSGPAGTPGQPNASWAPYLPPVITRVEWSPQAPRAGEAIRVEAVVQHDQPIVAVELAYRIATTGSETAEVRLAMERVPQQSELFAAVIPGQEALRIVRLRLIARDNNGVERSHPSPHDLRPSHSLFVAPDATPVKIPHAYLFHVNAEESIGPQTQGPRRGPGGAPGLAFERPRLERMLSLASVWGLFFANEKMSLAKLERLRTAVRAEAAERQNLINEILHGEGLAAKAERGYTDEIAAADARLKTTLAPLLSPAQGR